MKNVLVIGGSGFIGSHFLRMLTTQPGPPRITSVDIKAPAQRLPGVTYIAQDVRTALPVELADFETVIFHLAGLRTFPGHSDAEYFDTNVETTRNVLALAEAAGCNSIVFTSTMAVYPTGEPAQNESSRLEPASAYGRSKVVAETMLDSWLEAAPQRKLVICRPAVIFGAGDNGNFTRLANALRGRYFIFVGRRDTIKSAGYVVDLTKSFLFALAKTERRTVYNFAYPERLTIALIVAEFCTVGGFNSPKLLLPKSILTCAAIIFEILQMLGIKNSINRARLRKLNESTNIVPQWLIDQGFVFESSLQTALIEWRDHSTGARFQ